jgi:hypothetical protein
MNAKQHARVILLCANSSLILIPFRFVLSSTVFYSVTRGTFHTNVLGSPALSMTKG